MSTPLITLEHVGFRYRRRSLRGDSFWALQDISFELHAGETLGIIGRNGAGKSTLLRLLAGIILPDRGRISRHASTALLSLQLGFMPHLTGRENAILSGLLLGLRRHEIEARMPAIIDFAELGEFIDRPVMSYSSGMSARLGFAVAFQIDPDILLVDEVWGVGDETFRQKSTQAMRNQIKNGKTVVFVSHNAALMRNLCSRIVWIEGGISVADGDPGTVIERYRLHMQPRQKSQPSAEP